MKKLCSSLWKNGKKYDIYDAHRLSTIRNAGRILVLSENGMEEEGTHKELLNKGGVYAELYNMQFT